MKFTKIKLTDKWQLLENVSTKNHLITPKKKFWEKLPPPPNKKVLKGKITGRKKEGGLAKISKL